MFSIDDTTHKIVLTKGDDAEIIVAIQDANGADRGVYADDVITLTVRKKPDTEAVMTVTAENGVFNIMPSHTKSLPSGSYVYDVELKSFTGKIYTIIPKSIFVLEEEITR